MNAKAHMGRVAAAGCVLCHHLGYGHTDAEVHHIREGQGAAQRASDYGTYSPMRYTNTHLHPSQE